LNLINFFSGTVHVAKDKSLHGTYTGVEPMGLLWSMLPYAETKVLCGCDSVVVEEAYHFLFMLRMERQDLQK